MKFIITGATSFIGLEFTKLVLECGHDVYAVCREGSKSLWKLPNDPALTLVYASMDDYKSLFTKIQDADVFVNFAWDGTGHDDRNLVQVQRDNVEYTHDAMISAYNMGCKLFVESGSQAEYGTVLTRIDEKTECKPFSEYGKAKLETMEQGFAFAELTGMKYIHLRIFSLFGETDHPWTLVMSSLAKMKHNEPVDLSTCEQNWNFLHVEDAAEQIIRLCIYALNKADFESEVFNIASQDTRPLRLFVNQMKSLTNSKSHLNFGVIKPSNIVSLDPDVSKTKNAIGFISNHHFESDILSIYNKIH